ncbi:MAG: hypothetical protein ACRD4Y_17460, partial [Candidatus Acidiferrales bacterium]
MELTWYGPVKDFPAILPAAMLVKPAPKVSPVKTESRRGADAFHPRQTILSTPLHPSHPRQTLIQPAAPKEPPKILAAMPNIVRLADSQPALPTYELAAMRPKAPSRRADLDASAPDVPTL